MCYLNNTAAVLLLAGLGSAALAAPAPPGLPRQAADQPTRFEVVSIKPNRSDDVRRRSIGPQAGGFGALNVPARDLIAYAYGVPMNAAPLLIVGGPDWIDRDRYDVDARLAQRLAPAQYAALVRRVLEERFHVAAHRETRDIGVYALVSARSDGVGPGLRAHPVDCAALRAAARAAGGPPPLATPGAAPPDRPVCSLRATPGLFRGAAVSMAVLASSLSGPAGRPVIDKTGITGTFDVDLEWTPEAPPLPDPGRPDARPFDPNGPALFTALQEQLGLKLVSAKAPMEVVVIDRAERPEAN